MRIIAVRCARKRRSKEEKEVVKMPILQYKCKKCGKRFEELVKSHTDTVVTETQLKESGGVCPDCGGETQRDYSGEMYSATGKQTKKCTGHCATCGGCH